MSYIPQSRFFDPRRLFPAIETNPEESSQAPDVSPASSVESSTNNLILCEFDEALEHVALERCCVCPLCGAIVSNDGSVMG
jgi:hypothetical protein